MESRQNVKEIMNGEQTSNAECGREKDNRIWRVRSKERNGREILGRGLGS